MGETAPRTILSPIPHDRMYALPIGDLAARDHSTNVRILNNSLSQGILHEAPFEIVGETPTQREANRLMGDIYAYRQAVQEFFHPELAASIAQRYIKADLDTVGLGMDERVRTRLASTSGLAISTDLDGTITLNPNSYLTSHIPGSAIAEPLLEERGRESFAEVFAETWQPLLENAPEHFFEGGKRVEIRKGVNETLGYLKEIGADVTVVSANFKPFVDGVLSNIPNAEGLNVVAVTSNSIISTDKGTVVKHLAQEQPDKAQVFIGDGSSDLPAIEASELIACYFALEGTAFAEQLSRRNLPHFTYRSFHDIKLILEKLYVPPAVNLALPS